MSLLSHSFGTPPSVSLRVDFVYMTLLLRKGNSFYAIMLLGPPIRLFNSNEYSMGKLIIYGSSKDVTVKELVSFFSYFQVCYSYVDIATQIPIIRWSWQWSRLKNSNGLKLLHAWNHCPGHELSQKRTI